jgi:replication fork protection complex subunit Tof1/Swi1
MRLMMTLCGMKRLGTDDVPDASWYIPATETSENLRASLKKIQDAETTLATLANYPDAKAPEDYLRRVTAAAAARQKRIDDGGLSSDSEGEGEEDDGEGLFPAGGPTARKADRPEGQKKGAKKKKRKRDADELSEAEKARRAKRRRMHELEKRRKIKSDLYVHDSDDEEDAARDAEFFKREEELRKKAGMSIAKAMAKSDKAVARKAAGGDGSASESESDGEGSGRQRTTIDDGLSDDEMPARDDEIIDISSGSSSSSEDSEDDYGPIVRHEDADETPMSSQAHAPSSLSDMDDVVQAGKPSSVDASRDDVVMEEDGAEMVDDDAVKSSEAPRRRGRAGFVVDDSDSE